MTDTLKELAKLLSTSSREKTLLITAYDNFICHSKINCRQETINYYNKIWKVIHQYFVLANINCVEDLTKLSLEKAISYLKLTRGYKNNSLNKFIDLVKMVIRFNVENDICDYTNLLTFKKLPKEDVDIKVIDITVLRRIFEFLGTLPNTKLNLRNKLVLHIFLDTGIRLNELLNIKVCNINHDNRSILLTFTKTKTNRHAYLTELTHNLLQLYVSKVDPQDFLFINFETREQMHKSCVYNFLDKIKKELDIKQSITPHKWRHTLATFLLQQNVNLKDIQSILGHSDLSTTQKYLHVDNKKIRETIAIASPINFLH